MFRVASIALNFMTSFIIAFKIYDLRIAIEIAFNTYKNMLGLYRFRVGDEKRAQN
jgi:hypothetical protein